ncbi:MAG: dTDP-4-dehydrorhamnose 3,5-epimerase [Chitinophagaceae bacterium]|nr:dTDP-4-dehydrorhamnose 3,5-epimerase [Chitinophagaceae bacterium]MDP1762441.1 dTDP-4-dehydrorhamnose 3,5-epimerase [Sediminibacterium sp.]MDP1811135.1 dTDP-4-dehydrorhamnose 3,5-epimerase [Sediminibacterium sp.]MDP3128635.1 dTDP-4-dehydrorhamnose 3,5-epimerase [Sediminibacterium sp.]MDP3667734.1 dTDP-4-dehydrorhamnose 3,5-epimerase [Sediminibacterium sp.]
MRIERTILEGCYLIHDTFFGDHRGYFFESFNQKTFLEQTGVDVTFVQDNQSGSQKGVLRGLHFQHGEFAQAKLVRVLKGRVLDVAVDLRKESATFGKHISVELSEDSHTQFFIPRGFAHGFVVLSEQAVFFYKCDNYYNKASERGIIYNDADLGVDWQLAPGELLLSEKDTKLPTLKEVTDTLQF